MNRLHRIKIFSLVMLSAIVGLSCHNWLGLDRDKLHLPNRGPTKVFQTGKNIYRLALSPDTRRALCAGGKEIQLWDLEKGEIIQRYTASEGEISSISFLPNEVQAIFCDSYRGKYTCHLLNLDNSKVVLDFKNGHILKLFSPDSNIAVLIESQVKEYAPKLSVLEDTIKLWDFYNERAILSFREHQEPVLNVIFLDNDLLASVSVDGTIYWWDKRNGQTIKRVSLEGYDGLREALFARNSLRLLSLREGEICLWDIETGKKINCLPINLTDFSGLAFSPDGSRALSRDENNHSIHLWDLQSGAEMQVFQGHKDKIVDLAFSLDGEQAFSTSMDGTLCLWDMPK
ncbi:MAG: hypothetical protein AB1489_14745 [Acidobacteriota bacterium]